MESILHTLTKTSAALLCLCAFAVCGCRKDDPGEPVSPRHVRMQMSLDDRTYGETEASEGNIIEIRVYAFESGTGRLAGHCYASTSNPTFTADDTFLMDVALLVNGTTPKIDIFAIANESQIGAETEETIVLDEHTSRETLENLSFVSLGKRRGLPMSCRIDGFDIETAENAGAGPAYNEDEHSEHVYTKKISLNFNRCVAKIEVYAAKPADETEELIIESITLNNHRQSAFVFPQTVFPDESKDFATNIYAQKEIPSPVTGTGIPEGGTDISYTDTESWDSVMDAPYYIFETADGSKDINGAEPDPAGEGAWLEVKFKYKNSTPRSGIVYLPKIERNKNYRVFCLLKNSGSITINYFVAPWTEETPWNDIEFTFPTCKLPVRYVGAQEGEPLKTPEIYFDSDETNQSSYVEFEFIFTGPTGMQFMPTVPASTDDYQITVFRNGNPVDNYVADPETANTPYIIRVIAKKDVTQVKKINFAIVYSQYWIPGEQFFFGINRADSGTAYPAEDSPSTDYICIKHIPSPVNTAGQTGDEV